MYCVRFFVPGECRNSKPISVAESAGFFHLGCTIRTTGCCGDFDDKKNDAS